MKKRQIRPGIFETNSSSTHSLVICTKEQYEKWKNGDLLWEGCDGKFITKEEVDEKEIEDDIYDFDAWGEEYEQSEENYTSPSGDELIIRAYYGYD